MRKGFKITYNPSKKARQPWKVEFTGSEQVVSNFDFGTGKEGILKCAKCGSVHWEDWKK
jgi:hypothetical protein